MDIDAADRLYRAFHKTNEGAKTKQGLGFGCGAPDNGPWKKLGEAGPANPFVKQGEGGTGPSSVNAANIALSAQREREERASRVAMRMAELKEMNAGKSSKPAKKQEEEEDEPELPRRGGRANSSKASSMHRDRLEDEEEQRPSVRKEEKSGKGEKSSKREERHSIKRDKSSREMEEEGKSRRYEEESASQKSHKSHKSRSNKKEEDREAEHSGRSRGDSKRGQEDRYCRCDRHGNHYRDSSKENRQSKGDKVSNSRSQAAPSKKDFSRLIPGYDTMGPAEKLQACTRVALDEAQRASRKRTRQEAEEDEEEARAEGRESGGGPVRQWTRYNFNPQAPLAQESQPKLGATHSQDVASAARDLGVDKAGEALNPLSHSHMREVKMMQKRDEEHTAAIWGGAQSADGNQSQPQRPPQQQQQQPLASSQDHGRGRDHDESDQQDVACAGGYGAGHMVSEAEAYAELAQREGWNDEERPVIVLEEGGAAIYLQANQGTGAQEAVADTVHYQQKGMSWRDRANAAKAKKAAAQPPPLPPPSAPALTMNWRDKARAKGRGATLHNLSSNPLE